MNKYIIIAVVIMAILIGGYFFSRNSSQAPESNIPRSQENPTLLPLPKLNQDDAQMIMMNSIPFSFSPREIRAKVGQPVTVHVTAQGEHSFIIIELGVNVTTPSGKTTIVEFTPNKKGEFQFYCSIPGHRENGQVGTLIVE